MSDLQVQVRHLCDKCEASGIIQHPQWELFWEEDNKREAQMSDQQFKAWWSAQGFGSNDIPPEEVECFDCEGEGFVSKWITLAEFNKELLRAKLATRNPQHVTP